MLPGRLFSLRRILLIITASTLLLVFFLITKRNILPIDESKGVANHPSHLTDTRAEKLPRLAVIVPFRDRFDELIVFVPHLTKFLQSQPIGSFGIYIINQSARYRFNRGALANVGYQMTKHQSDYIAIHDVDLIPINEKLSYSFPSSGPYHLSSPEYHPQYNYSTYLGGILIISNEHFELVNGMSNRYFGWGLEDDDFYARIRTAKLPISRPTNLTTDRRNTFLHFHYNRKRDTFKTKEQRKILRKRDRTTGLGDLKYSVISTHNLTIDNFHDCTVFNVELYCDTNSTPWCLHNYTKRSTTVTPEFKENTQR